jgi:opacity protein-like surface antigen
MKKRFVVFVIFLFSLPTLPAISQAKGFALKATGGYGTMTTGDYNTLGNSTFQLIKDMADFYAGTSSGEFKKLNLGFEFEGEVILNLFGGFGLGVGVGYIMRSNESKMGVTFPLAGSISLSISPDITAIPITLSAYYFAPGVGSLKPYAYGGLGYYIGKIKVVTRVDTEPLTSPASWTETDDRVKDQGFGFHVGAGLEFKLVPKVSLFIEGKARYCKLTSWEGDQSYRNSDVLIDQTSGKLWYYEISETGRWYSQIILQEQRPTGTYIRNVREFKADLSGIVFRVGVIIGF